MVTMWSFQPHGCNLMFAADEECLTGVQASLFKNKPEGQRDPLVHNKSIHAGRRSEHSPSHTWNDVYSRASVIFRHCQTAFSVYFPRPGYASSAQFHLNRIWMCDEGQGWLQQKQLHRVTSNRISFTLWFCYLWWHHACVLLWPASCKV